MPVLIGIRIPYCELSLLAGITILHYSKAEMTFLSLPSVQVAVHLMPLVQLSQLIKHLCSCFLYTRFPYVILYMQIDVLGAIIYLSKRFN